MATFKIPGMRVDIVGDDIKVGFHVFKVDGLPVFQNMIYALWYRNLGPVIDEVPKPFADLTPQERMTMLRNYLWRVMRGLAQEGDKLPRDKQAQEDNAAVDHELDYVPEAEIPIK